MRRALPLVLALTALLAVALFDVRRVGDDALQPSLMPGDWVLLGPGEAKPGDVVLIEDPADGDATILRRVLAVGPASIRYEQGVMRIDGAPLRYREMGRGEGHFVLSERNGWLVRHRERVMLEPAAALELPADALWLMADNRDQAVDSRWWGPVPASAAQARLWLRAGSSDAWRGAVTLFSVDGPWLPPSKQR